LVVARFFSKPFFLAVIVWFFLGALLFLLADMLVMPWVAGFWRAIITS
jgi:hypothetical protein